MRGSAEWARVILEAGAVRRGHTVPGFNQSVAEHCWRVAVLLWGAYDGAPSAALLGAAMLHDVPELLTGDIPAPAKWASPALAHTARALEQQFKDDYGLNIEIRPVEYAILKVADYVELCRTAVDQRLSDTLWKNAYRAADDEFLKAEQSEWHPKDEKAFRALRSILRNITENRDEMYRRL